MVLIYTNPLTGQTEDGGENIALGESMVSNIVESQLLIEQTNGKYYITVGLGLASNVSNIRFKVMNSSGSMSSVSATKTGSSSANGDAVNHYRLQVVGTGIYNSQMIPQESTSTASQNEKENKSTSNSSSQKETKETSTSIETNPTEETSKEETTVGTITKESLMSNATGLSNHLINSKGKVDKNLKLTTKNLKKNTKEEKTTKNYYPLFISVGIVIILGGIIYVKKIKK